MPKPIIATSKIKVSRLFYEFFQSEKTSGIILLICTVLSLLLANSSLATEYIGIWNSQVKGHTLTHWINDGLMTIFFLLIGLELEREIYSGELSNIRNALLPLFSALGGVLVPAGIYLLSNWGSETQNGAGIPMATDIAFAIAVLSLLGKKVPTSLKIFLTALAVIDDLCAILVIAIFYSNDLAFGYLGLSLLVFVLLLLLNRLKVHHLSFYILGGILMWYFMLHSGIHASISGVLLAFSIPFGNGAKKTASYRLQQFLHKPVAFLIIPIFALANTCIPIQSNWMEGLGSKVSMGIVSGLLIGKPLGILLFGSLAVLIGICRLPADLTWKHIFGAGLLGGIGFTMSIFVTLLAFENIAQTNEAKIAIMLASFVAGSIGYLFLNLLLRRADPKEIST